MILQCECKINEEKFKSGKSIIIEKQWHITYEMVTHNIVEVRKRRLEKIWR
jgi:hypothetical protein